MSTKKIECANEEQWLAERKHRIGASEVSSVMGLNPYEEPDQLWVRKAGIAPEKQRTDAMDFGQRLEPVIRDAFASQSGLQVSHPGRYTIMVNEAMPFLSATLDGVVQEDDALGVVEIKNVGHGKGDEWDDDVPTMYAAQVQAQLAVTGYTFGYIVALIGGQRLKWHKVQRHDEFINVMMDKVGRFWHSLKENKPPEFKNDLAWSQWLKVQKAEEGKVISMPTPAIELHQRRIEVKREIAQRETELLRLDNQMRSVIGDAEECTLPDGSRYTLKLQKRKEHMVKASESRVLRYLGGRDE